MAPEPVIGAPADGSSFVLREWRGSGPAILHVHDEDDEAWHVLEGTLDFRFQDRTEEAPAGTTVFVPAGVAHTYTTREGSRYLLILTPRLRDLIAELQQAPAGAHPDIYRKYRSRVLE